MSLLIRAAAAVLAVAALFQGWNPELLARGPAVAEAGQVGGRVFVANEGSGTVSVLDSGSGAVLATICLGSGAAVAGTPQPAGPCNAETDARRPFYNGHLGAHGLWLTPDGALLLVANRLSGTVVAVDARLTIPCAAEGCPDAILGYTPVGREPHLATVRPGGREAWVAVRGESYLQVLQLDPARLFDRGLRPTEKMPVVAAVDTALGPSMVSFSSDGRYAFVAAGKDRRVDKIDAEARQVVASQAVPAAFTPFGLVSPDDRELYLVHKGLGLLTILSTDDLTPLAEVRVGSCANHVAFAGSFAYVTVGGAAPCAPAGEDREGKLVLVDRATRSVAGELSGPDFSGDPHGIWATADGRRLFVGHERGNRVTVLDLGDPNDPNDDRVAGAVSDPQMQQPIDVVIADNATLSASAGAAQAE